MHTPTHTLFNGKGSRAIVSEMGASLHGVYVPDTKGEFVNVALPPSGANDPSYAGAMLCPYAGRIRDSRITILGREYALAPNEGTHQLHGGPHNLAHSRWRCAKEEACSDWQAVQFTATLPDGQDGFPGQREFSITYRLWNDDRLELLLEARTDRATQVNLSHHAYWNLSGDLSRNADDHLLRLNARAVYLNDAAHLPVGLRDCDTPPFDVRTARPLTRPCDMAEPQWALANGWNHTFVLRDDGTAAELIDPASGRRLRLYTDLPCLVVYAGGYLRPPRRAVALEPQERPLTAFAAAPPPLLPGATYRRRICYAFDTVPQEPLT